MIPEPGDMHGAKGVAVPEECSLCIDGEYGPVLIFVMEISIGSFSLIKE